MNGIISWDTLTFPALQKNGFQLYWFFHLCVLGSEGSASHLLHRRAPQFINWPTNGKTAFAQVVLGMLPWRCIIKGTLPFGEASIFDPKHAQSYLWADAVIQVTGLQQTLSSLSPVKWKCVFWQRNIRTNNWNRLCNVAVSTSKIFLSFLWSRSPNSYCASRSDNPPQSLCAVFLWEWMLSRPSCWFVLEITFFWRASYGCKAREVLRNGAGTSFQSPFMRH